jgi:hypothetical protein
MKTVQKLLQHLSHSNQSLNPNNTLQYIKERYIHGTSKLLWKNYD